MTDLTQADKDRFKDYLANRCDDDLLEIVELMNAEISARNSQKIKAIGPIETLDTR